MNLEIGLVVGIILVSVGLAGSIYALSGWGARSFGPLNPPQTMRIVIPAVTSLTLGIEIIFSSFFLSILRMKRR
jgi:hypothetical protein